MKINDKLKKNRKIAKARKTVGVYVKITKDASKWLKKEDLSPQAIFDEALKELGHKE